MTLSPVALAHEDWYIQLLDDCQTILTEAEFTSRWALLEGYHQLGQRILQDHQQFERQRIYGHEIVQHVARSLKKSPRTIAYALAFAKKFPELDKLPGGKAVSWHRICHELLPEKPDRLAASRTCCKS